MEGLKLLKQKVEQQYLDDLDKAAETRIRCLDVINTVREMANQTRRETKAKKTPESEDSHEQT